MTLRPILFHTPDWVPFIGGLPVFTYSAMLAVAVIAAWIHIRAVAHREGIERGPVVLALALCIGSGLFGARALYFALNPGAWDGPASLLASSGGGLSLPGLLLGILVSAALVVPWLIKLDVWFVLDRCIPGVALALAIQRLGCYGFGCCFGRPTRSALGVTFPRWTPEDVPWIGRACGEGAPPCPPLTRCDPEALSCLSQRADAWALHHSLGEIPASAAHALPTHPTQLYTLAFFFALFVGLLIFRRWQRFHGQLFLTFLGVFGVGRFVLEGLRADHQRGVLWSSSETGPLSGFLTELRQIGPDGTGETLTVLTGGHLFSALALMAAFSLWIIAWRRARGLSDLAPGLLGAPIEVDPRARPTPEPTPP